MTMWKILNGHHLNNIGIEFQSSKTQRDHRKAPKTLEVGQGETPDDVRYIFRSTRAQAVEPHPSQCILGEGPRSLQNRAQ